jgi:putative Mg2+ transporter-C (MgtC) family protein
VKDAVASWFPSADAGAQVRVALQVLWAMVLGGLIGLERQKSFKPAGIRTHTLVGGMAALVSAVGADVVNAAAAGDPTRGMHAVITGIGFLGAGVIFQSKKGSTSGLTTAATVFFSAGVGVAVALGYGITATIVTVVAVVVLWVFGQRRYHEEHANHDGNNGSQT